MDAVILKDPETGWVNIGTYRTQAQDEKTLGVYISPGKHGKLILKKYWSKGKVGRGGVRSQLLTERTSLICFGRAISKEEAMARPLRIEYPGAFDHVTSRGNEQKDVLKS
jgi:hypothetical protein